MEPLEEKLIEANAQFYRAFARGDLAAMDEVWSRTHDVACIHPGWPLLAEREAVMASWRAILSDLGSTADDQEPSADIACSDPTTRVMGSIGYVICKESVGPHALLATNVFAREDDAWRLVHHHAAPVYADQAPSEQTPPRVMN